MDFFAQASTFLQTSSDDPNATFRIFETGTSRRHTNGDLEEIAWNDVAFKV